MYICKKFEENMIQKRLIAVWLGASENLKCLLDCFKDEIKETDLFGALIFLSICIPVYFYGFFDVMLTGKIHDITENFKVIEDYDFMATMYQLTRKQSKQHKMNQLSPQDFYKLGFIHGAMAMLQYIKARLSGQTMEMPQPQKLITQKASNSNTGKLLKDVRKLMKSLVKIKQEGNLDYVVYTNETKMKFLSNDFKYIVHNSYKTYSKRDEAIKALNERRAELAIDLLELAKVNRNNKELSKM